MVDLILNAVTKQLGTTFGNGYHYYVEDVEQGLDEPCFTVDLILPLQRAKSPVLYDRTMPIVIYYFSDSKNNIKKDCYKKGEQLAECLEYLPFDGGLIRGEEISWQMIDDVLKFFVTYKLTTKRVSETDEIIQTLESNVSYKQ